jgi:cyclophilin family peptidyl-prolyl cis-trans isomerase
MRNLLLAAAPLALLLTAAPAQPQASAAVASGKAQPSPLAPSEIVAAASKGEWTAIPKTDLLVMDLAPDAKGKPRRAVIQLMPPPFSAGWIGNIRKLAAAHWWDGMSVNRVQDNYVVQWGDPNADDKVKAKALPAGLATMAESEYETKFAEAKDGSGRFPALDPTFHWLENSWDPYIKSSMILQEGWPGFSSGWPVIAAPKPQGMPRRNVSPPKMEGTMWPTHCYGMVGVGRDLSPNTGSGAELYVVIGHAPRHLDRNIALVGRVIEGIEYLSSLPRGHGALGFVDPAQGDEPVPIQSIHPGVEVKDLPAYEYLSTDSASFAKYADARANRRDAFFIRPAGGADVCNIPVPVRRVK